MTAVAFFGIHMEQIASIKIDKLRATGPVNSGKCVEFSLRGHYHSLDLSHHDTGPDGPS